MSTFVIYYNSLCSKSRQALKILQERNCRYEIINYLEEGELSKVMVTTLLDKLKVEPRDLIRQKEDVYKQNNLNNIALTREELIMAIINDPQLLERPIIVNNQRAIIARSSEKILNFLNAIATGI